ncbi:MAG: ABC transporter ATP-binding protein, partial [Beijerinckiaceae bacterium]|nr:ABC transporter ATP-binding protein [Beijerinckiaceae bacterium]
QARQGRLVIAVTHDLTLAARMADRIVLMDGGAVVASGPPDDVLSDRQLAETYGIRALRLDHDGEPGLIPWQVEDYP